MLRSKDTHAKLRIRAIGCLLTGLIGVVLLLTPLGDGLTTLSYDLSFCFRSNLEVTNLVIVKVDTDSLAAIGHNELPPDRRVFAQLLQVLTREHAHLVLIDFHFGASKPDQDAEFAAAIKAQGNVILGSTYDSSRQQIGSDAGAAIGTVVPPIQSLANAAKGAGLLRVPVDYSYISRQIFMGIGSWDSAVAVAAEASGTSNGLSAGARNERWLNFYGPSGTIDSIFLRQALLPENLPKGFFQGRDVFIGPDGTLATALRTKDRFPTPYSRFGSSSERSFLPGVELLATDYLNLVRSDWLNRLSTFTQAAIIGAWGLVTSLLFFCFRPMKALLAGLSVMILFPVACVYIQSDHHLWWAWAIPAFVQTPLAVGGAMIINRWFPWPPVAFISYRRVEGEGSGHAQAIWSALEQRGYASIADVKTSFTTEAFLPQILETIDSLPNFILILSRDSLKPERINQENDVFRTEIQRALQNHKNVISVLIDDYKMPSPADLPPDIRELTNRHAFVRRNENPGVVVDEIIANLRPQSVFQCWRHIRQSLI